METVLLRYLAFTNLSIVTEFPISLIHLLVITALIIAIICFTFKSNSVYIVDFSCYLPPDSLQVPNANFIEHCEASNIFDQESINFQVKILERSGIGFETCMPIAMHEIPPNSPFYKAREETEMVVHNSQRPSFQAQHKS